MSVGNCQLFHCLVGCFVSTDFDGASLKSEKMMHSKEMIFASYQHSTLENYLLQQRHLGVEKSN